MVGFPAARKGDTVTHDLVAPSGVIGPPATGPCPMGQVMIENLPAAHIACTVACSGATAAGPAHPPPLGPPPPIVVGAATVQVHNLPAARIAPSGDMAVCASLLGDPKTASSRTVLIGGPSVTILPAPTSDFETIMQAIFVVKTSVFGKTDEGMNVVAKLEARFTDSKIRMQEMDDTSAGKSSESGIKVNDSYNRNPHATASVLVHEASHLLQEDELPGSGSSVDEEIRAVTNELDLYEEQRSEGYRDANLERQRRARKRGRLRDDVRSLYPDLPEHGENADAETR